MSPTARQVLLKANAAFLALFGTAAFIQDIRAIWFNAGPVLASLRGEPATGIGAFEAHGLAMILATCLWRAARTANPDRAWHATGAAIHLLLGGANIALWQVFIIWDMLALGYVSTALHALFASLHLSALASTTRRRVLEA